MNCQFIDEKVFLRLNFYEQLPLTKNIDELTIICEIRQYFAASKFYAIL